MQALMLAAGMGKRLGKYTDNNTKCMLEVAGKKLVDNFEDVRMSEFDIEKATMKNSSLLKPKTPHRNREEFLTALQEGMLFDKAVNKYAPISFKTKLKRTIKRLIPLKILQIIRKLRG